MIELGSTTLLLLTIPTPEVANRGHDVFVHCVVLVYLNPYQSIASSPFESEIIADNCHHIALQARPIKSCDSELSPAQKRVLGSRW